MAESGEEIYSVVVNDEEQYSVWPAARQPPAGWQRTGFDGTKEACLAHVDEVWTDMRPRSLREAMGEEPQGGRPSSDAR